VIERHLPQKEVTHRSPIGVYVDSGKERGTVKLSLSQRTRSRLM
jgi:hypothetical protein